MPPGPAVSSCSSRGRWGPRAGVVNTRHAAHDAGAVARTRLSSAGVRRGGDVSCVFEELKAVFDPRGGQWMGGKYVPSLLAAIGQVIENHMIAIGFIVAPGGAHEDEALAKPRVVNLDEPGGNLDRRFRQCPKCGQAGLIRQENCDYCTSCAYSKCS